jgi:diguanylate cyclase (GGDEF)-like protein/PAS domain S-box-containing protein
MTNPPSVQYQSNTPKTWHPAGIWRWLTEPHASIRECEHRRRARLLSAFLVVIIPLGVLAVVLTVLEPRPTFSPVKDLLLYTMMSAVIVLTIAYGLSRTTHIVLSATLAVGVVSAAILITASISRDVLYLYYLIIAVLMGGLFLSPRGTVLVLAATIAGTLLLATFAPESVMWDVVDALYFVIGVGALVVVSAAVRQRDLEQIEQQSRALDVSEKRFRALIENSSDGIALLGPDGTILYASPATTRISGYAINEFVSRNAFELSHPDDLHFLQNDFAQLVQEPGAVKTVQFRSQHKDGSWQWIEGVGANLLAEPSVQALVFNFRDITEHKQAEDALRKSRDELEIRVTERTAELTSANERLQIELVERKRAEEALQQANERLRSSLSELERRNGETALLSEMGDLLQTSLTAEEAYVVIAQYASKLFPAESGVLYMFTNSRRLLESVALWGESLAGESVFAPEECWGLRRGRVHRVEDPHSGLICRHLEQTGKATSDRNVLPLSGGYICAPLMAQGETLGILHLQSGSWQERISEPEQQLAVTVCEHIALALANLKLRETLRSQSIRDPLTGLFNRRYMEESLERELHRATRKHHSVAIVMLDIDHFKHFNDTFGHDAGDTLLRELGASLQRYIRGEDIACRYGGEEFTLILPETSLETAQQRAEHIREAVKHLSVEHRHQPLRAITLSLGVAVFPEHGTTAEVVLQAADVALYRAKQAGRDRVEVAERTE